MILKELFKKYISEPSMKLFLNCCAFFGNLQPHTEQSELHLTPWELSPSESKHRALVKELLVNGQHSGRFPKHCQRESIYTSLQAKGTGSSWPFSCAGLLGQPYQTALWLDSINNFLTCWRLDFQSQGQNLDPQRPLSLACRKAPTSL